MADDVTLRLLIETALQGRGLDDLKARLQEATSKTQEAKTSASDFSAALTDMGGKLLAAAGVTVGLAESVAFLKGSFLAFVEGERVLNQFDATSKLLGGTLGQNTQANREWLESLEIASGKVKEEIVPSYIRFVAVTGDVSEAQRLTQIAALGAKAGLGDVGTITQALVRYMETGQTGTKGFAATLAKLKGNTDDVSVGLKNTETKVRELAAAQDNAGTKIDQARVRWEHTKEAIGGLAFTLVSFLAPALKIVSEGIGAVISFVNYLLVPVETLGMLLGQVGAAMYHLFTGQFKLAADDMKDAWTKTVKIGQDAVDFNVGIMGKIDKAWDTFGETLNRDTKNFKDHLNEQKGALDQLRESYENELTEAKVRSVSTFALLNAEIEIYKRMRADSNLTRHDQNEATLKLLQAEKALNAEMERERKVLTSGRTLGDVLKAHQDELDKEADADRKAADRRFKLDDETYKKIHGLDSTYLAGYVKFLKDQEASFKGSADEKQKIYADEVRAEIEMTKHQAEVEKQIRQTLEQDSLALMGAVFGKSKAYSIAQAVISTYEAANAALDWEPQGWWNFAAAALVIATGLANVATISSTSLGAGFDDPQNDFAAIAGGRKWARDYINLTGAGFADELRKGDWAARASSVTNNNMTSRAGDRVVHITINGGVLGNDDVAARLFVKRITPYLNNLDKHRALR